MPAAQVELDDRHEAFGGVLNLRDGQEHLRVAHEAVHNVSGTLFTWHGMEALSTYFVILSSILRGSRMNVGRTTRLRSAPGRSWEMMCMRTRRES